MFIYDANNRKTGEEWLDSGGNVIRTITWTYNGLGQFTGASDPDSSYTYAHDTVGRFTSVNNNGTPGVPHVVLTYFHGRPKKVPEVTSRSDNLGRFSAAFVISP